MLAFVEVRHGGRCLPAFRENTTTARRHGGAGSVKVDTVKSSRVRPAVRPDAGRGYCGPKGTILFFLARATGAKAVPLLGVGLPYGEPSVQEFGNIPNSRPVVGGGRFQEDCFGGESELSFPLE